jgi:4'-phosphopantetheinyl transferase EntD
MMESLVPPSVATVETGADLLEAELFPEEREAVGRAVEKRRREFVTGRACARRALERLGVGAGPIASGERGEPVWPAGVVGSITHCRGFRACAVARAADVASVGIDAELHEPLPRGVLGQVASERERAELSANGSDVHVDKLLFSAKEAVYKAWYPLARRWLGFEDVHLSIDPASATFTARLLVPGPVVHGAPLTGFGGRWRVEDGVVATAVVVEGRG